MGGKTKAQLEAETRELKAIVKRLEYEAGIQRDLSEMWLDEIDRLNFELRTRRDAQDAFVNKHAPDIIRWQKFAESRRGNSTLYALVGEILRVHGADLPASKVRDALRAFGSVIQEIDDERIYWRDAAGREKATTIHAFDSRLSTIRKKLR